MSVRLDEKDAQEGSMPSKLPEGLKSIGMSIAPGGPPVPDYQSKLFVCFTVYLFIIQSLYAIQ